MADFENAGQTTLVNRTENLERQAALTSRDDNSPVAESTGGPEMKADVTDGLWGRPAGTGSA